MREDSRCFPVGIAGGGLAWDSPIGAAKGEIMWRPVFEPEDFDQTDAVGGGGAKGAPAIGRIGGGDGGCGEAERISGGFDLNAPLEAEGTVSAGCSDGEARVRVFGRDGGKY
ncbi:hypothetical protein AXF42_Ash018132 [Apostasia shenzhenica]|uniref:Uncharacterized protein n=1 Tax=Apostasia shenzhenica TaxID=1088818 RepID=A0A2I0AEZ1_9ASPA|nr:hypothetical protein AXF42_Ash018132 [Apostasia shenzhenica]